MSKEELISTFVVAVIFAAFVLIWWELYRLGIEEEKDGTSRDGWIATLASKLAMTEGTER